MPIYFHKKRHVETVQMLLLGSKVLNQADNSKYDNECLKKHLKIVKEHKKNVEMSAWNKHGERPLNYLPERTEVHCNKKEDYQVLG